MREVDLEAKSLFPFEDLPHDKSHHICDLFTGRASLTADLHDVARKWIWPEESRLSINHVCPLIILR